MSGTTRPRSMLVESKSQRSLPPSRPASLAGWESTSSVNTVYLGEGMEMLKSAGLPPSQELGQSPAVSHLPASERPYSTAVGWNSSATLRHSSSNGDLQLKWNPALAQSWPGEAHGTDGTVHEEADTKAIRIRYGLMLAHASLTIIKLSHTLYLRDPILLIINILSLLTFLIYIPAAFGLSLARKGSHFDHAGGEVAYLIVQTVLWTLSSFWAFNMLAGTDCKEEWDWFEKGAYAGTSTNQHFCTQQGISGGLSLLHTFVLAGWAVWVLWVVAQMGKKEGPGGVRRCFQVSAHWLMRGWPVTGGVSGPPY